MSEAKPSLAKAIQRQFAPTLRRDGFAGTGQRYWRVVHDQCQLVEIQGSRHGGKFAVNMGIQPISVPLLSGGMPEPKRLREMACLFRKRLTLKGADQWWDYQPNQPGMDAAAHEACAVYEHVGAAQFDAMGATASPLNTLTPEAFASRAFDFKGFRNTSISMAWALAHMRKAAGNRDEARKFAQVALEEIGDGKSGSGLRAELRKLLESD